MYRGTTPTITFTLPFDCGNITMLNLCFAQRGEIILEKDLYACEISGNTLQVELTEEDTLRFEANNAMVEMQLRIGCGETRLASDIMRMSVKQIIKEGCLK